MSRRLLTEGLRDPPALTEASDGDRRWRRDVLHFLGVYQLVTSLGAILVFIAHVIVVLSAFRKGILWGLAVLFIPLVTLIFVILNWRDTRRAVFLYVVGSILLGLGGMQLREREYDRSPGTTVNV